MGKFLVLAEKPSVGKDIARVLNANKKMNGYFEGEKYIVTWALGHLVTLADPEVYNKEYQTWNLDSLPIIPNKMTLVPIKQTMKQYKTVVEQMKRKDVTTIVIATDAGREGELVARWIIEKANINKKIMRLWISSVTDKAIKDGFNKLVDGKIYENLYLSAVGRAESDWLVGINCTRALTTKFNAQLSCGRVQTPTLAMIAGKEDEIRKFIPKKYYTITASHKGARFSWVYGDNARCFDEEKVNIALNKVKGKNAVVKHIEKTVKKKYPPLLYDLTELQRDGNKLYGFSPKETLSIMQTLYERFKVLTYPRTDSRYISKDIVPTLKDRLKACSIGQHKQFTSKLIQSTIRESKNFVDDTKVSDHHAIIPTEEYVNYGEFSDRERKIYDLVVKRFIAVMYPSCEYEEQKVLLDVNGETFTAKGVNIINMGFKEIYSGNIEEDDEQKMDKYAKNDSVNLENIRLSENFTSPPPRFNEASLLSAMENPSKYLEVSDKEMARTLGETGGLGTVATRADIIEKLFNSFYIEKKGKDLYTTVKGRQVLELVPKDLKSPDLTGNWEQKLNKISKGHLKKDVFINDIKNYTQILIKEIKNSEAVFKHDNVTGHKCPDCGKAMLEVTGKKGKMLVCQDRECGHRKSLSITTNARCPNCHKKLELVGDGENRKFVCKCGHREKYESFQNRIKENGNKAGKNDVKQYMQAQNKENKKIEKNNPMADALKGLKL